jgi:MFS family permease
MTVGPAGQTTAAAPAPARASRVRHRVFFLTFLLGVVLYADRAALSVLAPSLRRDLGLSPMAMGWIFSAFVWGYALLHVPAGWMGDRYGARRVLAGIVVLWSAFTAATALAWNLASIMVLRFLFGAAEAGATPGVSRSLARWAPADERARAQGFYFAGMSAGAAAAPPLVTLVLLAWGWRACFVLLGLIGPLWALAWYVWFRDEPGAHSGVNRAELALMPEAAKSAETPPIEWRKLLGDGNLRAILLMYFTYGYTGYIYITWFPSYLQEARHVSPALSGALAAVPSLLGILAKPLGGWWSDRMSARHGLRFGRRLVGGLGFGIGAVSVVLGLLAPNAYLATLFLGIADAGAALAHGVCFAVCLDVAARRAGTLSALMLTAGSIGNAVSALAFGGFLSFTGSWAPPFLLAMVANAAGALLWLAIDPERQLV